MIGHLGTPVPRQRFVEFLRQLVSVLDQSIGERLGVFAGDLYQHYVAGMTFHEGRNLATTGSTQQIALPVTWDRSIFNRGRTLADRYRVTDSAAIVCLLGVMSRTAHCSRASQMLQQLFLQDTTCLNKQATVNGF